MTEAELSKQTEILKTLLAEQQQHFKRQEEHDRVILEQFAFANKRIRNIEIRAGIFFLIIAGSMALVGCAVFLSLLNT